jgi:putative flavoprotein involved in K+ transport
MNDFDQSFLEFRAAEQPRRTAEDWLAAFQTALASQDVARIGALFHLDCHWRDILAFTWQLTSVEGRDDVATRLATEQQRTGAHGFHLPPGRKPPRRVKRLGIDSIETIFEFKTADGRGAGIIRLSSVPGAGGAMKAWLLSTTLEALDGYEEKIDANRPTGAAYSRNFGGDNWAGHAPKGQCLRRSGANGSRDRWRPSGSLDRGTSQSGGR